MAKTPHHAEGIHQSTSDTPRKAVRRALYAHEHSALEAVHDWTAEQWDGRSAPYRAALVKLAAAIEAVQAFH